MKRSHGIRGLRIAMLSLALAILLVLPGRASALVYDPFFSGSTAITKLPDNGSAQAPIGFTFTTPYYLWDYSDIMIHSNGVLTLGREIFSLEYNLLTDVYSTSELDRIYNGGYSYRSGNEFEVIAPYWTDLDPSLGGTITYGNPSPGVFVASWVDVPAFGDPTALNTFQVVITGGPDYTANPLVLDTGQTVNSNSVIFAYKNGGLSAPADWFAGVGLAGSYGGYLHTLVGYGIGDSRGNVSPYDIFPYPCTTMCLDDYRYDPWLFDNVNGYMSDPVAFSYVQGVRGPGPVIPEPSTLILLGGGLIGFAALRLRKKMMGKGGKGGKG